MAKKSKTGKARKDKFYHLAKETGYRSRAAFKLIQLNRKFEFLQKAKVLVDLCAAPGGWLQVAQKHMPVASIILGVDLVSIKPVESCITFQEDITTPKCIHLIKKELKDWKADVVLHDGAPNVGKNWIHDAYQQSCLTLSALKVATELLPKGGWFITKVFRSKDYNSLLWVLQQLFKKIHATKPSASRLESAEIFVVCQGYLRPDKIDPKFLDAGHVFQELDVQKVKISILNPEGQKKKKAEGYKDGVVHLFNRVPITEFIKSENYLEVLQNAMQLHFDDKRLLLHPLTTPEIVESCKDIGVLGRKEVRTLLTWRKSMTDIISQKQDVDIDTKIEGAMVDEDGEEVDEELIKVEKEISLLKDEERKDLKHKKKKVLKSRKKLQTKLNLQMIIPGDEGPTEVSGESLFNLAKIKSMKELDMVVDQNPEEVAESDVEDGGIPKSKRVTYEREGGELHGSGMYYKDNSDEATSEEESSGDEIDDYSSEYKEGLGVTKKKLPKRKATDENSDDEMVEERSENPLVVDLVTNTKEEKKQLRAEMWFDKDIFNEITNEADEDYEIDKAMEVINKKQKKAVPQKATPTTESPVVSESETSDSESDTEIDPIKVVGKANGIGSPNDLEIVKTKSIKKRKLDAEGLALGTMLVQSKKKREEIIDAGWNRHAFNDENLPTWFVEDETKYMRSELPVTKEMVQEYKAYLKEINARPIKKVVEAKARKKRRSLKRMEKARKKSEAILENNDMSEKEKTSAVRALYKKASGPKKKEVKYVVTKRMNTGKRMRKPPGVKGPVKAVDPRMKKDDRRRKTAEKKSKGKKGSKKSFQKRKGSIGGKKMGGKKPFGKGTKK